MTHTLVVSRVRSNGVSEKALGPLTALIVGGTLFAVDATEIGRHLISTEGRQFLTIALSPIGFGALIQEIFRAARSPVSRLPPLPQANLNPH